MQVKELWVCVHTHVLTIDHKSKDFNRQDLYIYGYCEHLQTSDGCKTSGRLLTVGGDPLDSSKPTPVRDISAPNHVWAGTTAPNIPSSKGTTITWRQ